MQDRKAVLESWMKRVWTAQDVDAIDELFVPAGSAKGLDKQVLVGPKQFKKFHTAFSQLLMDFTINIDHFIEQGEWVSALVTLNAMVRKNSQLVTITGNVYGIINNGKIELAFNHWDFLGLFTQMGLLPKDCFEQGLAGNRVI